MTGIVDQYKSYESSNDAYFEANRKNGILVNCQEPSHRLILSLVLNETIWQYIKR